MADEYGSGDLNPQAPRLVSREYTPQSTYDTFVRDACISATQDDIFSNAGPWKAKVLRSWKEDGENSNAGFFWSLFTDGVAGEIVFIKAWIPELSSCKGPGYEPAPDDHKAVEMCPTFVAARSGMSPPQVGTLVKVDFEDRRNLTFPIYLGPVNSADEQISAELTKPGESGTRDKFNGGPARQPEVFGGSKKPKNVGGVQIHPGNQFTNPDTGKPYGKKRRKPPNVIIIHESAAGRKAFDEGKIPDGGAKLTHKILQKKGLGVHYGIDRFGKVTQYADPVNWILWHAAPFNDVSVAIEIYNPFITSLPVNQVDGGVFPGKILGAQGWQQGANALIPTSKQVESAWKLIHHLTSTIPSIPLGFIGIRGDTFDWGAISVSPNVSTGIMAHKRFHHGDGGVIEFYCVLRAKGLGPGVAYGFLLNTLKNAAADNKKLRTTKLDMGVELASNIGSAFGI